MSEDVIPLIIGSLLSVVGLALAVLERIIPFMKNARQNTFAFIFFGSIIGAGGTYIITQKCAYAALFSLAVISSFWIVCRKNTEKDPEEKKNLAYYE